ncbi:MAG TPA: hypothetical protein VLH87_06495 [Pyrinomonadaceae bacterium]|nr:hypothetical protein [Pyrinomonadaceae bacterium]
MFIGHYAVGLAAKKIAPRASMGALIAAPILLDLVWPFFLLLGWEQVAIEPNRNPFLRLEFVSYPISHGLVAVAGWAILYASLYFGITRYQKGALVILLLVVSHWVLDYFVHRPDLPLYSGSRQFGLGLWNHPKATVAVELAMFAFGIWIYVRQTRAKDTLGSYAFWALIGALLLSYAGATLAPPPRSVKALALATLITWLFIPWAWWFDCHRENREIVSATSKPPTTFAGG